ncbi:PilZ domain-containing protein [Thermodesulfobacteriota bacterium]
MGEHRSRHRVNFKSSIEIDMEGGIKLYEDLENISMSGFFINNITPFQSENEYDFDLKLTCGTNEIKIIGRCQPVRFVAKKGADVPADHQKGVGFKITYLEPDSSEELYKLITFNTAD